MLAPISWRVPPRHYGPWEQFVSLLTEGLVARGVDVTLFATADSITQRASRRHRADGLLGGSVARREGLGGAAHRRGVRARGGVRRDPQQLRLPAADLQPSRRDAGGDDDPRLLVAERSCRCSSGTTTSRTTSRSATPTGTRASTTPRRSTTGSTWARSRSEPAPGELPALLRADPSRQGHRRGDRGGRARRAAARDRRHRPGRGVLRASSSRRASTASASRTSGRSARSAAASCSAVRARSCISSTSTSRSASASSRRWRAGRR